ncbi:hypothetical protein CDAR_368361 [Caerostris darwini]|uniref:Uncharacterized protein n=1 Tax=Caerostris darwini TaxID=1538125 RepID=A0AAV4WFY6_9ARAC|nr:hypothetical protein CDAR_368361 [Caerostris darwini]
MFTEKSEFKPEKEKNPVSIANQNLYFSSSSPYTTPLARFQKANPTGKPKHPAKRPIKILPTSYLSLPVSKFPFPQLSNPARDILNKREKSGWSISPLRVVGKG